MSDYKNQTKNIDTISFVVNGKSVIQTRNIESLKSRFNLLDYNYTFTDSLRIYSDTNIFKQYYLRLITYEEYLGLEEHLDGIIYIIVKKSSNEVVRINGSWILATFDDKLEGEDLPCRLLSYLEKTYFPVLKGKSRCVDWWSYTIENESFREKFLLYPPVPDEGMPYEPIYNFYYDVSFE